MRVPVQELPRVEPSSPGPQFNNLDVSSGGQAVSEGLQHLGGGLTQMEEGQRRAAERANAVAANDGLTALTSEGTSTFDGDARSEQSATGQGLDLTKSAAPRGVLRQKGKAAVGAVADGLNHLDGYAKKLEEGLANDEQRKIFRQHAQKYLLSVRERAETFANHEVQAAEVESLKGRQAETLRAIQGAPGQAEELANGVESYIRAMARSPEGANALVSEWRGTVGQTLVDGYLDAKDYASAEAQLTHVREYLDPKVASRYDHAIQVLRVDREAESTAAKLVEGAQNKDTGRVDPAKATAAIDSVPEGALRDEVRQRVEHRVAVAERTWKANVESVYDRAFSAYLASGNTLGAVDARDKSWLIQNDPDSWDKLRMKAQRDADHSRALQERRTTEHETDDQRDALVELRSQLTANPEAFRDMTVEAFRSEWGHRLSDSGFKEGGRLFAATKKEPVGTAAEFTRFVNDEVRGNDALQGKAHKKAADQFRAFMGDMRRAFKEKNKREPGIDDVAKFKEEAWKDVVQKGLLLDSTVPAWKAKQPAASAAPAPAAAAPAAAKVEVINAKGERGLLPSDKVDAWLGRNPGWRKR